ncbi:MAG: hypothetical protein RIE87_13040 [Rhodospirillales bacterium]
MSTDAIPTNVREAFAEEFATAILTDDPQVYDGPEIAGCAQVIFEGNCGPHNLGSIAYVENLRIDKSVKATIKVRVTETAQPPQEWYMATDLVAAEKKPLGCTRVDGKYVMAEVAYSLAGCE